MKFNVSCHDPMMTEKFMSDNSGHQTRPLVPNTHTNFRCLALLKVILPGNSQGKPGSTQSRVRSYGVAKEVALAITVSFFRT